MRQAPLGVLLVSNSATGHWPTDATSRVLTLAGWQYAGLREVLGGAHRWMSGAYLNEMRRGRATSGPARSPNPAMTARRLALRSQLLRLHNWNVRASSLTEEAAWLARNQALVASAFADFLSDGEWPEIPRLQRKLDRLGLDIDVRRELQELPGRPRTGVGAETVARLPIRVLYATPAASTILEAGVAIVRRGVDSYLSADDPAVVASDDPELFRGGFTRRQALRAGQLLHSDWPHPFGSGTSSATGWRFEVHEPVIRQMTNVRTLDDYLAIQNSIAHEHDRQLSALVAAGGAGHAVSPHPGSRLAPIREI